MSSEYAPGTLFRICSNINRYTAVLLKDGQLLEVKNTYAIRKETFPSVTSWCTTRGVAENEVKIDTSKGSGIVVGSNTHGFNYPTGYYSAYYWIKWLYSMIAEAAPQLFQSEELKLAYNEMVELCTKYKQDLWHWRYDRYHPFNLKTSYANDKWYNYPGYFYYENMYITAGRETNLNRLNLARSEIIPVYKRIYAIVYPVLSDYMNKRYNVHKIKKMISNSNTNINRLQKKADKLRNSLQLCESSISKEQENIIKYKTQLNTAQNAIL